MADVRAGLAAVLCGVMAGQPMAAAGPAPVVRVGEMQGQARVVHALNRLTFGPRPGEVAAVERMGLDRWFEQQLEPEKIDDSALDARLAQYPASQMSLAELEERYPGPGVIRAMINGRVELPSDPTARTIAVDEIAFYKIQKAKKEQTDAAAKKDGVAETTGMAEAAPAAQDPGVKGGKQRRINAGFAALNDSQDDGMTAQKPLAASEIAPDGQVGTAGQGMSADQVKAILALVPEERYRAVLAMNAQDLVRFRQGLRPREVALLVDGMSPVERETLTALPGAIRMVAAEALETRVLRDVYSQRELEAVMTDFWLNHFNVYVRKNQQEPYLLSTYERETIRPHALGKFEDLLVATAQSPAMLEYLDNARSVGPDSQAAQRVARLKEMRPNGPLAKAASAGLNENYGRELMELHTLGVNGGYTQADVTNVAKVFTGWTVEKPALGGGGFVFDDRRHEPGSKMVLGKTISEGGEKEGLQVLHMLATSPATAYFLCEKLAVRFVSDTPPQALVDRMSATFLSSDGDIKAVLRTMWRSPEFWTAGPGGVERAKVKTPEEFVFSAVRASGAEVRNPLGLVQSLDKLGMPIYGMQTPQGYSWKQDGWVSTGALVSRMNFALVLTGDRLPGTRVDFGAAGVKAVSYTQGGETAAKERALEGMLLNAPVSERTRATVIGQAGDEKVSEQAATEFDLQGKGKAARYTRGKVLGDVEAPDDAQAAVMAGLLLGSPEFQRR